MSRFLSITFCGLSLILAGCGGGGSGDGATNGSDEGASGGLSAEQLEHGIGPIEAFELGDLDAELATTGERVFEIKCSACHKFDERYVGPALGDILERRSPAFVMNMILNPEGMIAEHPEARAMLAEYMTPMANQNLTEEDARAVLEYFRVAGAETE